MKFRKALLGATLLGAAGVGAPGPALGQAVNGLYIGAGAGANFMHDESIRVRSFPAGFPAAQRGRIGPRSLSYDTGFVGLASVGYGFGNGLRVEVEGSYRQNKIDRFGGPTGFQAGGDQHDEARKDQAGGRDVVEHGGPLFFACGRSGRVESFSRRRPGSVAARPSRSGGRCRSGRRG